MTYSFPCQDLSLAGLGKGMSRDSGTRSGMLWEVERILDECNSLNGKKGLPQVLLMENVPQVIGQNNIKDFQEWEHKLEGLGYTNYVQVLNAKDYGIPQNRERCFMVSILGEYSYTFPRKQELKLRLKDMLDNEVDERYYLSESGMNYVLNRTPIGEKNNFANNIIGNDLTRVAGTITTSTTYKGSDNFIVDNMTQEEIDSQIYLKVNNATQKGYLEAYEGDGIDISSRMETHRGTVQKGMIQTLKTQCENGVVVKEPRVIGGVGEKKSNGGTQWFQHQRIYDGDISNTITTVCNPFYLNNLRIRKLTGKECYRLMGFSDEDYENSSKVLSENMIYHTAGDSIVVNVLMSIFGEMITWKILN